MIPRFGPVAARSIAMAIAISIGLLTSAAASADDEQASAVSGVKISKQRSLRGGGVRLAFTLVNCLEATVTVNGELQGYAPSRSLPWTFVLGEQPETIDLVPDASRRDKTHYEITYRWHPGGTNARPDPKVIYQLPYPARRHWFVSQGNFGRYSHSPGSGDEFAIDWNMPTGSDVCAARAGRVIAIKQDSELGGPDRRFDADSNYIVIRHADGTCGEYMHLDVGGALVKLGQQVEAGQPIGRSGNTGNSAGPHLHFGVFTNANGKTKTSIPIRWHTRFGTTDKLIEGKLY